MKLKSVLSVAIFSGCIVPILLAFVFFIKQDNAYREQQLFQQLNDVATIQHQRIKQYITDRNRELNLIKSRTKLRELIAKQHLFEHEKSQISRILKDVLQAQPLIRSISVFDVNGKFIVTTNTPIEHINFRNLDKLNSDNSSRANIDVRLVKGELVIEVFDHIDYRNAQIGFISVQFFSDELVNILSDHTGLGASGEIVLAGTEADGSYLYLTPTRHNKKLALQKIAVNKTENNLLTDTLGGSSSEHREYVDYRNVATIAITRYIPETGWGMVIKMDKVEAFQLAELYKRQSFYVLLLCLVGAYLLSHMVAKLLSNPFNLLHQAILSATKRSELATIPKVKVEEIDIIGQEFNRLVDNLYETEAHLHESIHELTRLNAELSSSAERFNRWKESNFIGIAQIDAVGKVKEANSTFLNMIGCDQQDLEQGEIDWQNLTPTEFTARDNQALSEAKVKGFWTPYEKRLSRSDDNQVPVLVGGSIFEHDTQELILFVIDLSEKYQQLEVLDRYRGIVENSDDLFAFVDNYYRFKAVNQKYLEMHGLSRPKVEGHYIYEILGESLFYGKLKPQIDKALNGEVVDFKEQFAFPGKDQVFLHVTYTPYFDEKGEIVGFIFRGEDITELKVKEDLLQIKEEQQSHILSAMLEGIITSDADGNILSFNNQAEKIFGYLESEVLGKSVTMLMPPEEASRHNEKLKRYLDSRESHFIGNKLGQTVTAKHKSGRHFPLKLSIDELPKTENGETNFIANCQDLTEIEEQKSLLNRSLKMESLGKVAGGVAHDFNNILGIILGYASLLNRGSEKAEKYANAIETACKRGSKLTKSLLTFAKQHNNSFEQCDLNKVIADNQELLCSALTSRIDLSLELASDIPLILAEKSQLEDLLLNMSINAKQAIKDVGTLKIGTGLCSLNQHKAGLLDLPEGEYVKLWIEDNGCGIAKENLSKIFEPFYTTKAEMGNGLGLSQCYGFVKALGGSIDVLSTENVGTKFIVYFPVTKEAMTTYKQEREPLPNVQLNRMVKHVLLVDDEPDLVIVNASILEQEGVKVTTCTSAKKALNLATNHHFDLIISDIIMPEMTGVELIKAVKNVKPNINYLYVSGYTNEEVDETHTLKKPYNKAEFVRAIHQQMSNSQDLIEVDSELN